MKSALYCSISFIVFSIVFKLLSTKSNELCKMQMICDLQNKVAKEQLYSEWADIKKWSTGELLVRVQKDCMEIVQMIVQSFPNFTLTVIRLVASLSLLWVFDSRLALIVLSITPLFIFSKVYYKKFRKLNKELKNTEGELSHIVTENLKFRMLIQTLGVEKQRMNKLMNVQDLILSLKESILRFSLISQTSVKVVVNVGFLITFVWGVLGLSSGAISFGMMSAFLQLVGRVQNPMIGLIGFFPGFVSFGVSIERVQEVLASNQVSKLPEQIKLVDIEKIELRDVSFKYEDVNVLKDVNLILKKGESTAVLGASGRGKTTLIRLLLSVITPQEGSIILNFGQKVEELNNSFKTNFSYVPQGDRMFSGTILENLLWGAHEVSEEKINDALYCACAEFVHDLPDGLNTMIGESCYGLSEGQAQRVAIARALLADRPIWLFDEITSALDPLTSILLIQRLKERGRDKIFVFVTHDTNLAELCDHTYYLS